MKLIKSVFVFLMLMIALSVSSQQLIPLKEVALPSPLLCSIKYFQTLGERHIFYGKKPPKPNGKVILFVPGYLEEADFLLIGNSFYKKAYDEGYQTAFVSMTRGQGDWVNGEILSRAIEQVKTYYNISSMNMIAHSNGGKASEVALFHHKKDRSIERVITLGTPFRGTQVADFADFIPISWVLDIIGVDAGRAYSTTYYCDTQWRPYFDKLETSAQKKKYYNYGSWGYLFGKELLFSIPMATTGAIIKLKGGGENDGVTPFYSSNIPGGNQLYALKAPQGKMNHMDMVYGQNVWKNISKVLVSRSVTDALETTDTFGGESEFVASSNYQILSDINSFGNLQKDAEATRLNITLIKEDKNASFSLVNNTTSESVPFSSNSNNGLRSASTSNSNVEELTIPFDSQNLRSVGEQKNEQFSIAGNSRFVAIAEQDVDCPMTYKFKNKGVKTTLEVNFPSISKEAKSKMSVSAKFYYLGSLDGYQSNGQDSKDITFKFDGDKFVYTVTGQPEGVYSMSITGEIDGKYKRDLVSGFTVGSLESTFKTTRSNRIMEQDVVSDNSVGLSIYPIPAHDIINVDVKEKADYIISDLQGRTVMSGKLDSGNNIINIQNLVTGIYFLKSQNDLSKETMKFLVK